MGDGLVGGESQYFSDVGNGFQFKLNDLVDVFVGTAANIRGKKTIPVRGRFKVVRVVGGKEMILVRPFVGSQHGPCPAYPPESCMRLKAPGSDVYGESNAYLSTYCSVLAVHQQYSHFLKLYIMKSILSWWYCIVQAYGDGYA